MDFDHESEYEVPYVQDLQNDLEEEEEFFDTESIDLESLFPLDIELLPGIYTECRECKEHWEEYNFDEPLHERLKDLFKSCSLDPEKTQMELECECYYAWRDEIAHKIESNKEEERDDEHKNLSDFEYALLTLDYFPILSVFYGADVFTNE